jgi:hypothetical protein
MIGLFYSDWLGCRLGSISYWATAGRGRDGKIRQPPLHCRGELRVDLAGFLNSDQAELSRDTPPTSQLCNCSTLQQIQDKLLYMFCHLYYYN